MKKGRNIQRGKGKVAESIIGSINPYRAVHEKIIFYKSHGEGDRDSARCKKMRRKGTIQIEDRATM